MKLKTPSFKSLCFALALMPFMAHAVEGADTLRPWQIPELIEPMNEGLFSADQLDAHWVSHGPLADYHSRQIGLGSGLTSTLGEAAARLRQEDELVRESRTMPSAFDRPVSVSQWVIELDDSYLLIERSHLMIVDPYRLKGNSKLWADFLGASSTTDGQTDQQPVLTEQQLKGFDELKRRLETVDDSHPLKAASVQGDKALLQAVIDGQGDLIISETYRLPKAKQSSNAEDQPVVDSMEVAPVFNAIRDEYVDLWVDRTSAEGAPLGLIEVGPEQAALGLIKDPIQDGSADSSLILKHAGSGDFNIQSVLNGRYMRTLRDGSVSFDTELRKQASTYRFILADNQQQLFDPEANRYLDLNADGRIIAVQQKPSQINIRREPTIWQPKLALSLTSGNIGDSTELTSLQVKINIKPIDGDIVSRVIQFGGLGKYDLPLEIPVGSVINIESVKSDYQLTPESRWLVANSDHQVDFTINDIGRSIQQTEMQQAFLAEIDYGHQWFWQKSWQYVGGQLALSLEADSSLHIRVPIRLHGRLNPVRVFVQSSSNLKKVAEASLNAEIFDANMDFYSELGMQAVQANSDRELSLLSVCNLKVNSRILWGSQAEVQQTTRQSLAKDYAPEWVSAFAPYKTELFQEEGVLQSNNGLISVNIIQGFDLIDSKPQLTFGVGDLMALNPSALQLTPLRILPDQTVTVRQQATLKHGQVFGVLIMAPTDVLYRGHMHLTPAIGFDLRVRSDGVGPSVNRRVNQSLYPLMPFEASIGRLSHRHPQSPIQVNLGGEVLSIN